MRAIDTNVLVRLIVRDDPEQVGRAEAFVEHGAWISLPVLAETVRVVRRAHATFARERSVDFSDCLVVELARKAGHVPVGTFDRKMSHLDGADWL